MKESVILFIYIQFFFVFFYVIGESELHPSIRDLAEKEQEKESEPSNQAMSASPTGLSIICLHFLFLSASCLAAADGWGPFFRRSCRVKVFHMPTPRR